MQSPLIIQMLLYPAYGLAVTSPEDNTFSVFAL